MIGNKDNEIILCKGIKLDRNYENVLSYSESDMVSLCRNNAIYQADEYNFIEKANNRIVVSHPYSSAMYANYVAFKNPRFGNKWIFAWVTDIKLINVGSTEITFEVDVWSTWYSRFDIGKAFIEREHVDDDTIGKHTIPEGLETGEYITQNGCNTSLNPVIQNMYYLADTLIVVGVTALGFIWTLPLNAQQSKYNGIYSGITYLAFKSTYDLELYIRNSQENLSQDNIACIFMAPYSITGLQESDFITTTVDYDIHYSFTFAFVPTSSYETDMGEVSFPKPDHLDSNYVPINNKLFTFPYCFLNITNNAGTSQAFNYELFPGSTYCSFELRGALGVGCSIRMYAKGYGIKGTATGTSTIENKLYAIDAGKLPTCGWLNDAYTNWLTSNAVNIGLNIGGDLLQTSAGITSGNPLGIIGGFTNIANTVASVYEHSLQPPTAKGGINQGDLNLAQRNTYNGYPMSIKKEFAVAIDSYFSRFGYKVNEVKQPNLNSRTQFNFIKVGGMDELISGDIPSTDLEKINEICRKGVTIFHNYNNFGNYTISNPIRS
jgi:hypothetical protein